MRISVIGCGYLGAVHAASMATLGHEVVGIDVDERKVALLQQGKAPFYEPGFEEILQDALSEGNLSFSTDYAAAAGATVHFIGVGTPQTPGEQTADLAYVDAAIESLSPYLQPDDVVAGKSTVPVGTAARLQQKLGGARGATLVWNPEFLREGFAVNDTIHPDRIVYGLSDHPGSPRAKEALDAVYSVPLAEGVPLVVTDLATAELVKVSANAFLATKISFINAVASISDIVGGDISALAEAIGYDDRIGAKFLRAGVGFGGGCLPKDIRAFRARAEELGLGDEFAFLREVDALNINQRKRTTKLVQRAVGGALVGKRIAVLGLAFKPNSDDIRDSPALAVAVRLKGLGAEVVATDPEALANARRQSPQLTYVDTAEEAVSGADAVVLLTEWDEYKNLDPASLTTLVGHPSVVDGRNALDPQRWKDAGWSYIGIGRR